MFRIMFSGCQQDVWCPILTSQVQEWGWDDNTIFTENTHISAEQSSDISHTAEWLVVSVG